MTMWLLFVLFCLIALGFVVVPLYSSERRLTPTLATVIVLVVCISASLYHFIGSPNVQSGASELPNEDEMVAALEERLESSPDDVNGWLMLGRSYQTLKRYDQSISAFERLIELEQSKNAESMVALAIVLMEKDGGNTSERAASLFENALALEPNNANALFYGGAAAARRGNNSLAADRWEMLLGQNAPSEVRELLQQRINEWRGIVTTTDAGPETSFSLNVSVSDAARAAFPPQATVFIIARNPEQPAPPIAVKRRRLSEFPTEILLGDGDAMLPGRTLSGIDRVEFVARISLSGGPMEKTGDWFGAVVYESENKRQLSLVINQQVP